MLNIMKTARDVGVSILVVSEPNKRTTEERQQNLDTVIKTLDSDLPVEKKGLY